MSWRGDGTYFVVSALAHPDDQGFRRRILRVYDRQAVLQSTSEAVGGLEHTVSWRPSGNLIASTQRFGFEGGGSGREGRHDVVFFERNGLRHGEFTINPEHFKSTRQRQIDKSTKRWGYRVHDILWSSDSNVLCLWIETDFGDIGNVVVAHTHQSANIHSTISSPTLDYRELSLVFETRSSST